MAERSINPVFRMFDEFKAREFYVDWLGMTVDWEHRFGDDFPLYMQVSSEWLELHLSEHHGDCSPGGKVRVKVSGIDAFHEMLSETKYKYNKPGIEKTEWDAREVTVIDPFGNKITFFEPTA